MKFTASALKAGNKSKIAKRVKRASHQHVHESALWRIQ
jgi:hypothetical protein